MFIQFEKCGLELEEIRKKGLSISDFAFHEQVVLKHIKNWIRPASFFPFQTSGSTGHPKRVQIPRRKIEYSCDITLDWLDPNHQFTSSLLCIDPEMIGGAMVVFRALRRGMDLRVLAPQPDPAKSLKNDEKYDLISLVPLQLNHIEPTALDHFHTILVGGASIPSNQNQYSARIFSTFGMTETVSHFALRNMDDDYYECIGDTELVAGENQQLRIRGTITNGEILKTNDLVTIISPTRFKWLGRSDFVINTGGVKVIPEKVERDLKHQIEGNFIISSIPDPGLGNKLVLLIEGRHKREISYSKLSKYEKPKEIYVLDQFVFTPSGKINRMETRNKLLSSPCRGFQ